MRATAELAGGGVGARGGSTAGGEMGAKTGATGGGGGECSGEVVAVIIISELGLMTRATGELLLLLLLLLPLLMLLLLEGPSGPRELGTGDGAVVAMTRFDE